MAIDTYTLTTYWTFLDYRRQVDGHIALKGFSIEVLPSHKKLNKSSQGADNQNSTKDQDGPCNDELPRKCF